MEKSLKAVLAERSVEFPFIHDIGGLADLCEDAGASLPKDLDGVDRLTPYATGLRYDDDQPNIVARETAFELGDYGGGMGAWPDTWQRVTRSRGQGDFWLTAVLLRQGAALRRRVRPKGRIEDGSWSSR